MLHGRSPALIERLRRRYAGGAEIYSACSGSILLAETGLLDGVDVPERSLKRRFKAATGSTLIEYLQNLRVEEAKRLLERGQLPIDEVSEAIGYLDISFFRRLFKRLTG